jgi:hypothetical protein
VQSHLDFFWEKRKLSEEGAGPATRKRLLAASYAHTLPERSIPFVFKDPYWEFGGKQDGRMGRQVHFASFSSLVEDLSYLDCTCPESKDLYLYLYIGIWGAGHRIKDGIKVLMF